MIHLGSSHRYFSLMIILSLCHKMLPKILLIVTDISGNIVMPAVYVQLGYNGKFIFILIATDYHQSVAYIERKE